MPEPEVLRGYFCLATIWFLILSYVACGTIFFLVRSSLRAYGRPSTIFFAYASPIPGSALSSSSDALLMSSGSFFFASDLVSVLALAGASVLGCALDCASAGEAPSETTVNRTATSRATSLTIGVLLATDCERRSSVEVSIHHVNSMLCLASPTRGHVRKVGR